MLESTIKNELAEAAGMSSHFARVLDIAKLKNFADNLDAMIYPPVSSQWAADLLQTAKKMIGSVAAGIREEVKKREATCTK